MCVTRYAQITENNKFDISLQYLKKEVSDEVDFLHADKHESFLQIDSMIFDGGGQSFRNNNFAMFLQYLEKEVRYEVDFLHADKHKVSYKLILTLWPSKFPAR